jgi:hypothetical protein
MLLEGYHSVRDVGRFQGRDLLGGKLHVHARQCIIEMPEFGGTHDPAPSLISIVRANSSTRAPIASAVRSKRLFSI